MVSWHNKYAGEEAVLCGTGPSLWNIDPSLVRNTGRLVFGLNNSFELLDLDFWMGFDAPDQFDPKLWSQDNIKLYAWNHRIEAHQLKAKNIFFYKAYGLEVDSSKKFDEEIVVAGPYINFIFEGYTFSMALHMLHWLGFKRVFLVGCDFGGTSKLSQMSTSYTEKGQQHHLKGALGFLEEAHRQSPIEFVSCTPDSPINLFLDYKSIGALKSKS